MSELVVFLQITTMLIFIIYMISNNSKRTNKVVIKKVNEKEMDNLRKMRSIKLTEPLTERSRPVEFDEIIDE